MKKYMSFKIPMFAVGLVLGCAAPAFAAEVYSGEDIQREIIGRTIYLSVPLGGEFPLNYRRGGVVDGNGEALGLGKVASPKDSGRWWIDGAKLCQQFKTWYGGKPMCFDLTRAGSGKVKWLRNDGDSGIARIGGG